MIDQTLRAALTLGFVACGASVALAGCDDTISCTAIGCNDSATLTADLPVELGNLDIEVCVNDRCVTGVIINDQCNTFPADPFTEACVAAAANGERVLTVNILFSTWGALRDSDRYHLRVVDEVLGVLVDATKTATYTDSYPNGRECDEPCRAASVDFSSD